MMSHDRYLRLMRCGRPQHHGDAFSVRHPAMPAYRRAKIFKPFAALSGFEEAVADKDIVYSPRHSCPTAKINKAIAALLPACGTASRCRKSRTEVSLTYFEPVTLPESDGRNDGMICGLYLTVTGTVKEIDLQRKTIKLSIEKPACISSLAAFSTGAGMQLKEGDTDRTIEFRDIESVSFTNQRCSS